MVLAIGCHDTAVSNPPATETKPGSATTPVSARMTTVREADALVVSWVVENRTPAPIWVLDTVLAKQGSGWAPSERAIVARGEPGEARLVLGYLSPQSQMPQVEQGVARMIAPIATQLGAGETRKGTVRVGLPVAPWHPYLEMASLKDPKRLVLRVGYLTKEPPWSDHEVPGGRVPALATVDAEQQWATSESSPLP